jgi:hypothetical protein
MLKVIIDFDGTLTAEETQARPLAEKSLDTLANEIIGAPRPQLADNYEATRARLLAAPHRYWWEVNGLVASYCDEGAFILNTTTLQEMLRDNPAYARAVDAAFPQPEYDSVADCTNHLFHRHTAELPPAFRPAAHDVLISLAEIASLSWAIRASTTWTRAGHIDSPIQRWATSRSGRLPSGTRWTFAARLTTGRWSRRLPVVRGWPSWPTPSPCLARCR